MLISARNESEAKNVVDLYGPIGADLARAEEVLAAELKSKIDFVTELTSRVQLYRGKRLRPALLLLCGKACGTIQPDHHVLAAVVEMIHAATLVHDDILDEAQTRRHVTTVNAEWGSEPCVLLGDFLFTHSFHLAASLESTYACRWIGKATNLVCEGELHQIARRGDFGLTEAEYVEIIQGKTAELIACCCGLGAHCAGASPEVEAALSAYGMELGIAFQIADDLIDLESDEAVAGKSVGSDLLKQKMTLPLIRFRDTADASARALLRKHWEDPKSSQRDELVGLLMRSDALDYTRAKARSFANSAAKRLDILPDSDAKQILLTMARFVVDRPA